MAWLATPLVVDGQQRFSTGPAVRKKTLRLARQALIMVAKSVVRTRRPVAKTPPALARKPHQIRIARGTVENQILIVQKSGT